MKSMRDKEAFIDLRAKGLSFAKISNQIGVSKPIIIPNLDAPHVLEAFELYVSGLYSIEGIRHILVEQGMKLSKSQFYSLLRNPIYAGWVVIKEHGERKLIPAVHAPIVPQSLFQKAQTLLMQSRQKHRTCIKRA